MTREVMKRLARLEREHRYDYVTVTFADGTKINVTGGQAVALAYTRSDIVQATGGPGNGMLPSLITALFAD